ncbi:diaminopropionate ammonia-lyase [Acetobacter sp. TBRC 12305]|uniref:Diaminopropionate ammonia-lyase n=1 Tax=Acetobacter garciniae TaxID=2817435 RepID=A0A939KMQ3_9PROT|nr:diaminopropionate ammonia-lyase [Acetobacter garciniae]MBO1325568.1 diaminopropionate ammonia-lyase [Acetobacter garciniae]MBX0345259.1 diaminopropionate ammonia-lyase [Acetobacter garciniae]
MFLLNNSSSHNQPLSSSDTLLVGRNAVQEVERFLSMKEHSAPTPLYSLPEMAREVGIGSIHVKDEGQRLGLGSFKAVGGGFAVARLVLEKAVQQEGRVVDVSELYGAMVRAIAAGMTFACATDGNHGRAVAQGAAAVGAKAVIFVHKGVSPDRIAAIARFGAEIRHVDGTYDQSVFAAAQAAADNGWITISDTSWPGYEYIPGLVMQGYTNLVCEALRQMSRPPTHVFVQAGVGGIAAAVAGHLAVVMGAARPVFTVVEPARAACLYKTAEAGQLVTVPATQPTIMAMLECYKPSLTAWRILARTADAFMTVDEEDAVHIMQRLGHPAGDDPPIISGESGGVGLAGLLRVMASPRKRAALGLDGTSRVFVINTEGATDPVRYAEIMGQQPCQVSSLSGIQV